MGTQFVRRAILILAAVLSAVVVIGGIVLDRSPSNPPCKHLLMNVDYLRPAANVQERDARKKPHYMDVGFGCP